MQNEIMSLKQMLAAHKDTPLGQQQNLGAFLDIEMAQYHHQNPYGMAVIPPPQNPGM